MQKSYKGLTNIGATCYINSFIQTLFMTPEFKDGIYGWKYQEKLHPARTDSILYQLQKLFARLEMGYTGVNTLDLTKSFQWHDNEAFNQQDIQEFNRVLFDALQKSLQNSPSARLIKDLYEGELARFTKCLSCHHESVTHQPFQDVILIVKDIYGRIYSDSLQLSLQRYIKPELLDENNLYNCSACEQKVRAQRGVKFIRLPKLLNLVLQRFHFDYDTFTRNKINDKLAFPFVLNFNNYNNGYEQIPNKLNEDSSDYFLKEEDTKKTNFVPPRKPKVVSKSGTSATQPAVAGKVKTKPSANTKSFLQEMRKKKMQQQLDNEDLVFVSGNATIHSQSESNPPKIEAKIEQPPISNKLPDIPPPPPLSLLHSLQQPTLTTAYTPQIHQQPSGLTIDKEIESLTAGKQKLQTQKDQKSEQLRQQCTDLVQQYLKDGPLVYELYSILVHSGTANAGHYFGYIKSPDNDKWFVFNDERVTEINVTEIDKTFGGAGMSSAYVLYYRLVEEEKYKMQFSIPEYIVKAVKEEEKEKEMKIIEKAQSLEHVLILKIYFQLGVRTIQIHKNSTLQLLYQKARELFSIKFIQDYAQVLQGQTSTCLKPQNLRLRLFNPANDTKLDTYTGKSHLSLSQLGIRSYNNLLLQIKADSEQFQEYVAGFMSVRVALWEENTKVVSLDEKDVKLHKVSIGREWRMQEVEALLRQKRAEFLGIEGNQSICVIKRHQNDEYLYHQVVNLPEYYGKTVDEVGIFEAEILFLEQDGNELSWPNEFENEIHRITIKVVDKTESHNMLVDSRTTLQELKQTLYSLTGNLPEQTIVRRGNRSGLQLKNVQATLKQNRFITGTTLFLEKGIPARVGEVRIQLFLSSDAAPHLYNRLHQFQFIADVPIDTNLKASEVKASFLALLKQTRGLELAPNAVRIREKVNDKMGKIYREKPMKEQQIIEKREIALEIAQDNLDPKDFSIYVRAWDQHNWKLSQKYQLLVNKNTTMQALASQIHEVLSKEGNSFLITPEDMDVCRVLSIHKFGIIDLVDMEYFGMTSEACVLGQPLFVNSDGLLYIIKQTGIQPRELTKEEEQLFGGKIRAVRPTRGRGNLNPTAVPAAKKEKGIVITVVEKEQQSQPKQ